MIAALALAAALAPAAEAPAAPAPVELTAPGPQGPLAGTLLDPGPGTPAVVIVPGSGPTDRDGDNPLGIRARPYRLLAEALAAQGVATLRIDKRGMFGSRTAAADPNAVTIADYAADVHAWAEVVRRQTGRGCVWLLGHSEGGLVVLAAAQQPAGICGVVLLATPGRPLAETMRDQLSANPANAPILAPALAAVDALAAGRTVDPAALPPPVAALFPAAVQPFVIDLFRQRPAALAAALRVPVLIVQGTRDLQVSVADAQALAAAQPRATLVLAPGVNHVLKAVAGDDRAANLASYADPALPVAPAVVDAVAGFVKR